MRISRRVLQIKGLPSRPSEYDGLLCLGHVPAEVDEATLRAALQRFGTIEYCAAPEGSIMQHRVKFATHSAAEQAKIDAPNLGICKFAFIAYRDYDPYDGRGWCTEPRAPARAAHTIYRASRLHATGASARRSCARSSSPGWPSSRG